MALNGQASTHALHPMHKPSCTRQRYPEEASMGVPVRWAFMASQQQEQQLQMAKKRPSMASLKKAW